MKNLMLIILLTLSTTVVSAGVKVIYGEDNRVDPIDSTNSVFALLAKSTAAMIPANSLSKAANGLMKVNGISLSDRGMCKTERFATQMTAANCSGFLVTDKLLVTAGHCIRGASDCSQYRWVFDYAVNSADQTSMSVPSSSVYSCKTIIDRELSSGDMDDWALIELDRPVTDRAALKFRTSGRIDRGEEIVVIGHPSGLPTKIADGAQVRSHSSTHFVANLDTYGGNSGSAVLNVRTGEVEGILVRGATDYVYNREEGCRVSNYLGDNAGRGEDVTYITNIKQLQNL